MHGPLPLFHTTILMPIEGMPAGWSARVLLLQQTDGTVEQCSRLTEYMKAYPFRSRTWQDTVARALGLMWDFWRSRGTEIAEQARKNDLDFQRHFLRAFALALIGGTEADEATPDGLRWPRLSRTRTALLLRSIENFSQWLSENTTKTSSEERQEVLPSKNRLNLADFLLWSRMRRLSVLSHISQPKLVRRSSTADLGHQPRGNSVEPAKFFPPASAEQLLWQGYLRPGCSGEPNPYLRYHVRDQMIALLDGWGGLRRSEGLHLWIQDVVEDTSNLRHAVVVLNHPSEYLMKLVDPSTRKRRSVTREQVLSEIYGLRPRNLVLRGRYHVGWKGMDLNKQYQAYVHWSDETAGMLFWTLYVGYLKYVRTPIMLRRLATGGRNHPFLFVSGGSSRRSELTSKVGDPYSFQAYERNHEAAVRRIGLPYGKEHGTTTHGLRHMYGQTLTSLGVPAQIIKKGLHHRNYLSQLVYTVPSADQVNTFLHDAWNFLGKEKLGSLLNNRNDSSIALHRLSEHATGGFQLV